MKTWKSRPVLAVIGVILLAFVGCSGDSPTEPSKPGSGNPIPPSDSVTITVTVSGVTPTSAIVTATIDSGNAADGTAVEFETTLGTFLETGTAYALRSTEGGKAFVTVLAAEGEKSTMVRVRSKSTIVDREVKFTTDEIPTGSPAIQSVTPATGSPAGGYVTSIRGRNFFEPVRVFFGEKEAIIASYTAETPTTPAEIKAVVPSVILNISEQFKEVAVTVVGRAGTANEVSGSLAAGFRYELEIQTPSLIAVAPSSGPNEGNTRITIFGEGFQSPLVAYFGSGNTRVDLELVSVSYNQIIAVTPPAAGLGSAFLNSSVSLTVQNIASNKSATLGSAFRYGPEMQITSVSPTVGSALGGTRVTITGFGFDEPVAVSLAGVPAQVIRVSGTEIVVIASAPLIRDCSPQGGGEGPVSVTNIEEGNTVESDFDFTYLFNEPVITFVAPVPATEGQALSVTVLDPGLGNATFSIGGRTVFPASNATSAAGEFTYQMTVPTGLEYDTVDCTSAGGIAGTANAPTDFDLAFRNVITGCDAALEGGITINPTDTTCVTGPVALVGPDPVAFGPRTEGAPYVISVNVTNLGSSDLIITNITLTGDAAFTKGAISATTIPPGPPGANFDVTFTPPVTGVSTDYTATLQILSNGAPVTVDVTGTGNP